MKAFVTGSTGMLGINLIRQLTAQGHEVKALVRSKQKGNKLLGDTGAEMIVGDMEQVEEWATSLQGCDTLFHTAAYFRETFAPGAHWPQLERINVTNTVRLFEEASLSGVGKIIHTSSNATIRKREDGTPSNESDVMSPGEALNDYGRSKVIGDQRIAVFSGQLGVPVVTMKPSWMIGPWDAAPTSGGKLVLDYMNRRLPGFIADSGIDVVDPRDVAEAMIISAERITESDSFILSAHHVSQRQLMEVLEEATGIPAPRLQLPKRLLLAAAWAAERYAAATGKTLSLSVNGIRSITNKKRTSAAKAESVLGIHFRPLIETIRDTVNWYKAR
ncbi:dihydroflavonol-4-reductase [Paenibacillus forsythiae]|uniref:Dihydroflavonol-4-reductase n=1 Tax=Paenibacillus forsythiae TaxID=365616 RepID=A0ABU3H6H7_9BACL|nr:NAD-dependent epimerase/dehydratase family protein [Paenibacillus forsythiae]MDT3426335.1 dihydroflavonol-4-reductase [Paenibacillus forsythiae]